MRNPKNDVGPFGFPVLRALPLLARNCFGSVKLLQATADSLRGSAHPHGFLGSLQELGGGPESCFLDRGDLRNRHVVQHHTPTLDMYVYYIYVCIYIYKHKGGDAGE